MLPSSIFVAASAAALCTTEWVAAKVSPVLRTLTYGALVVAWALVLAGAAFLMRRLFDVAASPWTRTHRLHLAATLIAVTAVCIATWWDWPGAADADAVVSFFFASCVTVLLAEVAVATAGFRTAGFVASATIVAEISVELAVVCCAAASKWKPLSGTLLCTAAMLAALVGNAAA